MEIFCFFMGVLYAYTTHYYLPIATLALIFITPRYTFPIYFILGLTLALAHEWLTAPSHMPDVPIISQAQLEGTIESIPIKTPYKTQFMFAVHKLNGHKVNALVTLSWYQNSPHLHAGQAWLLKAKLKEPRNFNNPGSFDYVQSLKTKHVYWTGYVRSGSQKTDVDSAFSWLTLREHLSTVLNHLAPDQQTAGIVEALTLNITSHISAQDWDLFRRTGTTHLFGISGEHIALLSGFIFIFIRCLWSKSARCCLLLPAQSIAACGGLLIASFYALLAGFCPPVQRALAGCFFYAMSFIGRRRFTTWQVWRYALFLVLCIEPHVVFMQGFYFSFLAVACIVLTQQRWRLAGIRGKLALQLSCLLGLMPLSFYWYSYGSINSFIANIIAIPLVGFLIVPLSLLTLLISASSWSWILMKPLSYLIKILMKWLAWCEYLEAVNIHWSLNSITLVLPLLGALLVWVLLPIKPFKYLAWLWLVLPFFPPKIELKPGEALIDVLDVGQGLAVSIQTQHHTLLYDTGDQWFQGSDLGQMVVLPFYQTRGVKKIDALVISHPDKDHRGGLKSIQKNIPVTHLIVNDPIFYHQGMNCHYYPDWEWDGVHFRFLSIKGAFGNKNNNSCILQIATSKNTLLLTGDIERQAEDYLIRTYGSQLRSEILIVPHHGSKTSSSYRFLLEVAPRYAIASLGFANRFRFPHKQTINSMKALNIPFYRTDECGMTELKLTVNDPLKEPTCVHQSIQKS
jgi:competence protein ComEC